VEAESNPKLHMLDLRCNKAGTLLGTVEGVYDEWWCGQNTFLPGGSEVDFWL
jgi:hypothetical protein